MKKFLQKFDAFLCLNAQSRWLGIFMLAFLLMSLSSQRVMANYFLYPSELANEGNGGDHAFIGARYFKATSKLMWVDAQATDNGGNFTLFSYPASEIENHKNEANENTYYKVYETVTYYKKNEGGAPVQLSERPSVGSNQICNMEGTLNSDYNSWNGCEYAAVYSGSVVYKRYTRGLGWEEEQYSYKVEINDANACVFATVEEMEATTPESDQKRAIVGGTQYVRDNGSWVEVKPAQVTGWDATTGTLTLGNDETRSINEVLNALGVSMNDVHKILLTDGSEYDKDNKTLTTSSVDYETLKSSLTGIGLEVDKIVLGKYVTIENGVTTINTVDKADPLPENNIDSNQTKFTAAEKKAILKASSLKLEGTFSNNAWDALKNYAGIQNTPASYITGYRDVPVQMRDENGELIFENGEPVYEAVWVEQYDENGNLISDENGNPVLVKKRDSNGNVVYVTESQPVYSQPASYVHSLDLSDAIISDTYCTLSNNFKHVESVVLPTDANYKRVPNGFASGSQLQTISIPANVEEIGKSAFAGCGRLTTVTWPQDSHLKRFEESAFENCNVTGDIVFPASVEYIGAKAFKNSLKISSVTFPQGSQLHGEGHGIMSEAFWMDGKENALRNVYVLDTQHLINCDVKAFDYDNTDGQTQMNTVKTRLHYPPEYYYYYVGDWKARVNGGIVAGHNDLLALRNLIENESHSETLEGKTITLTDDEKQWVNGFQKFVSSGIPVTFDTQWRTYSDVVNIRVPLAANKVADVFIVCGYEPGRVLLKQMHEGDIIPAHTGVVIRHYVSKQDGNGLLTFPHVTDATLTAAEQADERHYDRYCYVIDTDSRKTYHADAHEFTTGIETRLYKPTGETLAAGFEDGYPNYLEFIDCKGKQRAVYNAENDNIVDWPTLLMAPYSGQKVTYRNFLFANGEQIQHAKDVYDAWKRDPDNNPNPNKYGDYTSSDWKPDVHGKMGWGFFRCASDYYKVNSKAFLHYPATVFTQATGGAANAILDGEIITGSKSMALTFVDDYDMFGGTATAIQQVNDDAPVYASDAYYTLQGTKIEKPVKGGVYIHNGKKIIVK